MALTQEFMASTLESTVRAALDAEFAEAIATDPTFDAKMTKLARAIANGVANGVVPLLTTPATTQVVSPAGAVIGSIR